MGRLFLFARKEKQTMRKTFIIKCKVPVEFHVDAPTAEGAIDTIRSMFSDREDPDYANIIEQAVNYSLDNDMVREFDAIEQQKRADSTHR
jgi:hypothetical protein